MVGNDLLRAIGSRIAARASVACIGEGESEGEGEGMGKGEGEGEGMGKGEGEGERMGKGKDESEDVHEPLAVAVAGTTLLSVLDLVDGPVDPQPLGKRAGHAMAGGSLFPLLGKSRSAHSVGMESAARFPPSPRRKMSVGWPAAGPSRTGMLSPSLRRSASRNIAVSVSPSVASSPWSESDEDEQDVDADAALQHSASARSIVRPGAGAGTTSSIMTLSAGHDVSDSEFGFAPSTGPGGASAAGLERPMDFAADMLACSMDAWDGSGRTLKNVRRQGNAWVPVVRLCGINTDLPAVSTASEAAAAADLETVRCHGVLEASISALNFPSRVRAYLAAVVLSNGRVSAATGVRGLMSDVVVDGRAVRALGGELPQVE